MQIAEVKIQQVSPLGLSTQSDVQRGPLLTGKAGRFGVTVISKGEAQFFSSVGKAWEALGFAQAYYGFGSRVQIQVQRDGFAVVEHGGEFFMFAKVAC